MESVLTRYVRRGRIHRRVRKKIQGSAERPRLCVFRSKKHIYAQLIDDAAGATLAAASSKCKAFLNESKRGCNKEGAAVVGKLLAERATEKGIKRVVFDRGGYLYHGRVKALADASRKGGLEF